MQQLISTDSKTSVRSFTLSYSYQGIEPWIYSSTFEVFIKTIIDFVSENKLMVLSGKEEPLRKLTINRILSFFNEARIIVAAFHHENGCCFFEQEHSIILSIDDVHHAIDEAIRNNRTLIILLDSKLTNSSCIPNDFITLCQYLFSFTTSYLRVIVSVDSLNQLSGIEALVENQECKFFLPKLSNRVYENAIARYLLERNINFELSFIDSMLEIQNRISGGSSSLGLMMNLIVALNEKRYGIESSLNALSLNDSEGIPYSISHYFEEVYWSLDKPERSAFKQLLCILHYANEHSTCFSLLSLALYCSLSKTQLLELMIHCTIPEYPIFIIAPKNNSEHDFYCFFNAVILIHYWPRFITWIKEEKSQQEQFSRYVALFKNYQNGNGDLLHPSALTEALGWIDKHSTFLSWTNFLYREFNEVEAYILFSKKEHHRTMKAFNLVKARKVYRARIFMVIGIIGVVSSIFLVLYGEHQRTVALKQFGEARFQSARAKKSSQLAQKESIRAKANERIALNKEREAQEQKKLALLNEHIATTQRHRAEESSILARNQQKIASAALIQVKKEKNLVFKLRMLAIAKSMAIKSQTTTDSLLKARLARQAYLFSSVSGGSPNDPDIYEGLYRAVKATKDKTFNSLLGHSQNVRVLSLPLNYGKIISAGSDGKVFSWSTQNEMSKPLLLYFNANCIHKVLSVSSDGKQLYLAGDYPYIILLDLLHPSFPPKRIPVKFKEVLFLGCTKVAGQFIYGSQDGELYLWENNRSTLLHKSTSKINCLYVSNTDEKFIYGNVKGQVVEVNIIDSFSSVLYDGESSTSAIFSLSVSPNEDLLAIGNERGEVFLLSRKNQKIVARFIGHNARVNALCFSPDMRQLASGSFDKTVRLWTIASPDNPPIVLKDHHDWVWSIQFSPNGDKLLAGCKDNLIRVWPTKLESLAAYLCSTVSSNFSLEEWNYFVGDDIPYESTCP